MKTNRLFQIVVLAVVAVFLASGCIKTDEEQQTEYTLARELLLTQSWIDAMVAKKLDIDTTSTGLLYIVDKEGTGEKITAGKTVTVKYATYFVEGTYCDSSEDYTFVHRGTTSSQITGWNEAIDVMKKGETAVFLVPSSKAYGASGSPLVPPYTALLFYIQVVDVQ